MPIELSKHGLAKCPSCGKWNRLEPEHIEGVWKEFSCCNRNFMVALDDENFQRLIEGKQLEPVPSNWFVYKNR